MTIVHGRKTIARQRRQQNQYDAIIRLLGRHCPIVNVG
jgi:hypothetical protein